MAHATLRHTSPSDRWLLAALRPDAPHAQIRGEGGAAVVSGWGRVWEMNGDGREGYCVRMMVCVRCFWDSSRCTALTDGCRRLEWYGCECMGMNGRDKKEI